MSLNILKNNPLSPVIKSKLFAFVFFIFAIVFFILTLKSSKKISVVAVGNISCDQKNKRQEEICKDKETYKLVKNINPAAFLTLGDLQYQRGEYENYVFYYDKLWGDLKNSTYPVPGNHEYRTVNAEGYFDYFNGKGNFSGKAGNRNKGYYSFNIGSWHIIALNSMCEHIGGCDMKAPQTLWLQEDLKRNNAFCSLVFFHYPPFWSNPKDVYIFPNIIWNILYDNGVDIAISGFRRYYERNVPINKLGELDGKKGIRIFNSGAGGESFHNELKPSTFAEIEIKNTFGVLKLTLGKQTYQWEFISIENKIFDKGKGACH